MMSFLTTRHFSSLGCFLYLVMALIASSIHWHLIVVLVMRVMTHLHQLLGRLHLRFLLSVKHSHILSLLFMIGARMLLALGGLLSEACSHLLLGV